MQITESQLSKLKKYTSLLLSEGLGGNGFTPSIKRLVSVSDKNNGWDKSGTLIIECIRDGYITQEEYRASTVISKVVQFKFDNRDLNTEYDDFLLKLDIELSESENELFKLENPKTFKCYSNKNKTFIARSKRDIKRHIKYINNFYKK